MIPREVEFYLASPRGSLIGWLQEDGKQVGRGLKGPWVGLYGRKEWGGWEDSELELRI